MTGLLKNSKAALKMTTGIPSVSLIIPTYGRDQVLVETLREVLNQTWPPEEILVVDQTPVHEASADAFLEAGNREGRFKWLRLTKPGLAGARNRGVLEARSDVVLFIDDDVLLPRDFVQHHRVEYASAEVDAVAGRVVFIRPGATVDMARPESEATSIYANDGERWAKMLLGGNFSVRRQVYVQVRGFDEWLVGSANGEDTDFHQRLIRAGKRIAYTAGGWLVHLRAPSGGCRIPGNRTTPEWTKSYNFLLFFLRYPRREYLSFLWRALRGGPLRREIVFRPWIWPWAWTSLLLALGLALLRARAPVKSPFGSQSAQ